uniref:Uncharacterized protein n=2 Tax=Lygus hesperus TaxID=30085 RepID=A0A146M2P9_LYGHE
MPFWNDYVVTNPEVDDDDLPLPQNRLFDDNGNLRACPIPEEAFYHSLSGLQNTLLHFNNNSTRKYDSNKRHTSGRLYAKKSSLLSSARRAGLVQAIKRTLATPFQLIAEEARHHLKQLHSHRSRLTSAVLHHHHSRHSNKRSHITHSSRKHARHNKQQKQQQQQTHPQHLRQVSRSRSNSPSASSQSSASSISSTHRYATDQTSSPQPKIPSYNSSHPRVTKARHSSDRSHSRTSSVTSSLSSLLTPSRGSASTEVHRSSDSKTSEKPCTQWSLPTLRSYAKQHHISIAGLRNKTDIVNAITCASSLSPKL